LFALNGKTAYTEGTEGKKALTRSENKVLSLTYRI
jgi:hypothetical protein